jgi:hypothetical protein
MMDPGKGNAARWGPEAALDKADREQISDFHSSTKVARLEPRDDDIEIEGEIPPLVPEGEYLACFIRCETKRRFKGLKAFLYFRIQDIGDHYGTVLYRSYHVVDAGGKKGRRRFKLKPRSQLFLDLCGLYGTHQRPDRVSVNGLRSMLLRVHVHTVVEDYLQRPLPESLQYSVIDELICHEAGTQSD